MQGDAVWGCPECGNVEELYCDSVRVSGHRAFLVTPDGIDFNDNGGGNEWEPGGEMECRKCGHRGPVPSFAL